jgi:hypothetical protein
MSTYSAVENTDTGFHELQPALDDGGLGTLLGNFSLLGTAAAADAATLVPYSGAAQDVDLGSWAIVCGGGATIGAGAYRAAAFLSSAATDGVAFLLRDSNATAHEGIECYWMVNLDEDFAQQDESFDSVCMVITGNADGSGALRVQFITAGSGQEAWVDPNPFEVHPNYVQVSQLRLAQLNSAPSSASDTGTAGEIRITAGYVYVCVAENTWKRAALATW